MIFKPNKLSGATAKVYDYLFDEIIHNRLTPGTALSEMDVAARLQSSRTPVREALMVLESEGLVQRAPSGRGCFVADISTRDVEEIFELRILLELCALRTAYALISDEELNDLEARLSALTEDSDPDEYYGTDRDLHSLLITYCGNARLVAFLGILNAQIERVRLISAMKPARLTLSREEHLDIVRALKARNLPEAEKRLNQHIEHVRDSTKEVCKYLNITQFTKTR